MSPPRAKRRRVGPSSRTSDLNERVYPEDPLVPISDEVKARWNGFCEMESEPALFSVMLREFGVSGVKIQEVISLDDEIIASLHKPVYGLIFLFRWREEEVDRQEASCPDGLCVALLNIVNNIESVNLGENLQSFKNFTTDFTPALRGDAINNFEFVKSVHNSFARKMDMLNSDLQLKNEARSKRSRGSKNGNASADFEAGFHFIAFVPAMGKVWKLDGLERQPQALGPCSEEDWMDTVKPMVLSRMLEYEEDQIEFSILGVVRDPLVDHIGQLAQNVKALRIIDAKLAERGPPVSNNTQPSVILGPEPSLRLAETDIDNATIPAAEAEQYESASPEDLLLHRQTLVSLQQSIKQSINGELQSHQEEDDYASGRRHDYGPAVRAWIKKLARRHIIQDLVEKCH
ncbi:ubiquitin carboxyl-terminal hydrolase, family 1 protein [Paecilomyces variotii No. 5]|uniref:ubiquitinyl hydrolase 1 n=1 Tax=Byssochlamys spectabilis (strain No. 5 / NBRC 109023) TaxID=1356009 RepID=V5GFZ4_BYSSN|nr:ubiquitin carboxyl-terminal hydrolase, family 1 protein [Paecilomyces variotii No. 5]